MSWHRAICLTTALSVLSFPASAQQPAETPPQPAPTQPAPADDAAREEARRKLEAEIGRELGSPPAGVRPATPAPGGISAAPQPPATGGNPLARLLLLPDISAIGSAALAYDTYDVEALSPRSGPFSPKDKPRFLFQELELALQAVVDPYVRADVFIAFTPEEGVDIEEAYVTSLSLPLGLQLRGGKFFSPFGRMNQQHPHVWEFVDAPLANNRLLAEEALGGPGVELGWLAPLPWFAELRIAGQTVPFPEEDSDGLTAVGRLLNYFSLSEAVTLGVGVSAARTDAGAHAFRDLGGVDVHLRWRSLERRSYVALQSEVYLSRLRGDIEGAGETEDGGYAQVFWKPGARFGYGFRYDWSPTEPEAEPGTENRYGLLAGFFPSEFQRIRVQVSYDQRPGGADGWEALLQLEWGMGAHGAHPF
jgi:hypothetical protein